MEQTGTFIFWSSPRELPFLSSVRRIFRLNQLAARAVTPETTVPHLHPKVTKKQRQRKLEEYGPKKPVAMSTLQHFRGAFVFGHMQENKWGDGGRRKRWGHSEPAVCNMDRDEPCRPELTHSFPSLIGRMNESIKTREWNTIPTHWKRDPGQSKASFRWRSCKTSIPRQTPSPPSTTAGWPSSGRPHADF